MPFDANKFINAGQFGDYSSYSGMGGDQQMKSVKEVAAQAALASLTAGAAGDASIGGAPNAAAVPPQSFGEMATQQFNQAIAPTQQKATNFSNAFDQASQGNAVGAVNAYRGFSPAQPPTQPNTQPYSQPNPNVINQHYGVE